MVCCPSDSQEHSHTSYIHFCRSTVITVPFASWISYSARNMLYSTFFLTRITFWGNDDYHEKTLPILRMLYVIPVFTLLFVLCWLILYWYLFGFIYYIQNKDTTSLLWYFIIHIYSEFSYILKIIYSSQSSIFNLQ